MPAFFHQCMAQNACNDDSSEYMNITDSSGRTGLMACARAGSIENARKLLNLGCKLKLTDTNKYGESAIFFALRSRNWEFLRNFKEQKLVIQKNDMASRSLINNRAIAGDISFFQEILNCNIAFGERSVIDEAMKHNHVWFAENWPRHGFALHAACFYGQPDCVKALCAQPNININRRLFQKFEVSKAFPH